jgi:hypothetical protein
MKAAPLFMVRGGSHRLESDLGLIVVSDAASNNDGGMAKLLVDKGADVNCQVRDPHLRASLLFC